MNYKFMLTNFVNKQISYFFPPRCFLELIKFRPMNNKFMLTNFVNEQISYFFPPRCFLVLMRFYRKKVTFYHLNVFNASQCLLVLFGAFQCLLVLFNAFWCFLIPFSAFQCLFVLVKSYRKKKTNWPNNLIYTTTVISLHEKPYFLFHMFRKDVLSKKLELEYDFSCIIRKDDISFFPKI